MIIYKENSHVTKKNLQQLYSSVNWTAYTNNLDVLEKACNNSLSVITAWHSEHLIGLIRVIGDGYTIMYVQDILVEPAFQNQKIGTTLMNKILSQYKDVRQKVLLTEDAADIRHFYEKFGFKSCDEGSTVAFYREF
ncbi:GNAT family N-acetyltransferase [Companilactobacillus zhachilii]|uniref:N-acetyltransferase n=1 Tax=Companilactobacillus zhachilii TaxID=2304606 RepID=A0A386PRJ5_9LACO|nr:GNAT family N-acetyltransferase [Companilactobacillus zhachilii]AYE37555.1 N-acetyltransferase [Companilactobacillus zhachilii]MBL3531133.1 GNAT family N-acetyltransferase [Companilactobacillus zhachilii]